MILRSVISAGLLFVLYNLFVTWGPVRDQFVIQSQWQENLVKAQEYALQASPKSGVIVGSSLSARLSPTALSSDFYNLAFSGDGPFTGLELIGRSRVLPQVLLIETNLVLRKENEVVLNSALRPIFSNLRPILPGLRERYQPANFLAGKIGGKLVHSSYLTIATLAPRRPELSSPAVHPISETSFASALAEQKAEQEIPVDPIRLHDQIAKLKARVDDLTQRGVRCVLLEMPVDHSLIDLPQPAQIRTMLNQAFPEGKYFWIKPDSLYHYATVDGVHLPGPEADAYAERILRYLSLHPAAN